MKHTNYIIVDKIPKCLKGAHLYTKDEVERFGMYLEKGQKLMRRVVDVKPLTKKEKSWLKRIGKERLAK